MRGSVSPEGCWAGPRFLFWVAPEHEEQPNVDGAGMKIGALGLRALGLKRKTPNVTDRENAQTRIPPRREGHSNVKDTQHANMQDTQT